MTKSWLFLCGMTLLLLSSRAHAQFPSHDYDANLRTVRMLLQQPESRMDLARIKLTVDQLLDPAIDKAAVLKQLDDMAIEVKRSFPPGASSLIKFKALRDYLYHPAVLSGRRPFLYNFADDRNPRAKLLSVYLATHRGNCVSMPLLFVILGQKLDIPVTLATAPAHLYVKFRGDNGRWYGVETTSGAGWAADDWQQKQFPTMTPTAVSSGLYMQPLTKREAAAAVLEPMLQIYESQHGVEADDARVKLALLMLDNYPKSISAMLHAYFGYLGLRQRLFVERYPQLNDIPVNLRRRFDQIEAGWSYWGNRAKALGYQPPTPAMEVSYRERLRRAKEAVDNPR